MHIAFAAISVWTVLNKSNWTYIVVHIIQIWYIFGLLIIPVGRLFYQHTNGPIHLERKFHSASKTKIYKINTIVLGQKSYHLTKFSLEIWKDCSCRAIKRLQNWPTAIKVNFKELLFVSMPRMSLIISFHFCFVALSMVIIYFLWIGWHARINSLDAFYLLFIILSLIITIDTCVRSSIRWLTLSPTKCDWIKLKR